MFVHMSIRKQDKANVSEGTLTCHEQTRLLLCCDKGPRFSFNYEEIHDSGTTHG